MTGTSHPDVVGGWLRPLPGTGLTVSAVTLGASPLGHLPRVAGADGPDDQGVATVLAALDSPIRTVDTSNGYGDGESERRIGEALAHLGGLPDDALVLTKVDPRGSDYSGARVRASVDESRNRLGIDHLSLVHLHDPEYHDFATLTAPGGAVDTLVRLKEEGVVGSIGLAGGQVQEIARYLALGVFDVLLVHNRWTLLDRSASDLLDEAVERGMGIFNAAVYGGGLLAGPVGDSPTYGYRPAPPELLAAVERMRDVCAAHGTDLATAALHHSLRDPRFATTVVGMSRSERVGQTLASVAATPPDALWPELEALVPPSRLWLDAPFD